MFIALKKIYTFNSIYIVYVVHTYLHTEKDREILYIYFI